LVGIAKDIERQAATQCFDANQVFAPMHDKLTHGNLAGLLQSITDDRIGLVRLVSIRQKIVGLLVVPAVDLGFVNEAHHVDGVLGLQLQLVNFFGVDQNVMPLGVFVAFDDFFLRNL